MKWHEIENYIKEILEDSNASIEDIDFEIEDSDGDIHKGEVHNWISISYRFKSISVSEQHEKDKAFEEELKQLKQKYDV